MVSNHKPELAVAPIGLIWWKSTLHPKLSVLLTRTVICRLVIGHNIILYWARKGKKVGKC